MGSANGCCRNPQVDNNKGMNENGNQPFPKQPQYGGAWGEANGHNNQGAVVGTTPQNQTTNGSANGHPPNAGQGPGPGDGSGQQPQHFIESAMSDMKKNGGGGTSKAIGSVLLMFMNSFSQQPRDLLIHLGAGSQTVRPASFVMEDTETLKTATQKKINVAEVNKRGEESDANFNVPTPAESVVVTTTTTGLTGTDNPLNGPVPVTAPTPVVPTNYNTGAVSRIINSLNSLNMIPARTTTTRLSDFD